MLSSIVASLNWVDSLLTGHFAVASATLMTASCGFALLAGRINWRRAAQVLLGMTIVFGSHPLAEFVLAAGDETSAPPDTGHLDLAGRSEPIVQPATPTFDIAQGSLQTAYRAAQEAAAIRFPAAHGTARFTALLAHDGSIAHLDARGEGLSTEVVSALAQVIAASGARLPTSTASVALPPLTIEPRSTR